MEKILLVEGMSCGHCEKAVKDALEGLEGVSNVVVNLETKRVEVEGENLEDRILKESVEDAGYEVVEIK